MACQKLLQILAGAVVLCAMGSQSLEIVGVADWSQPPHPLNVVCYIATWANYRVSPADFFPGDIDPAMCTHLVYAFVGLDNSTYTAISLDPWADLDPEDGGRGFFRQMTGLKASYPHLKVLLAIGGDGEGSINYSQLVSDPERRRGFIDSIVPFLQKYDFDGLDLDWEYPGKRGGLPEDKGNFVAFCRELREAFNNAGGMILSSAIGAGYQTIDISYDIVALGEVLDLMNVMTYDYHGSWDNVTGVNSPLYPQPDRWSVEDTLTYLRDVGAPLEKITLGLPLYGHTFVMHDDFTSFGGSCDFVGFPGDLIGAFGFVGYMEACRNEQSGAWTKYYDEGTGTPYMIQGNHLISYDDEDSITKKVDFGVRFGVGGMMVWSMDTDDFRGVCGGIRYPLMTRLNLAVVETLGAIKEEQAFQMAESTTAVPTTTTDNTIGWTKPPHDRPVICYVSTWANYRPKPADFIIDNIDCTLCTHLVYAFAGLDNVTYTIKSLDPNTDLPDSGGKDYYRLMTNLRNKNPHLKVLLAIGGFSDDPIMYSELVSSGPRRRVFVYNVIKFINEFAFDGLDLDWEYPGERGGKPQDKQNFVKLVKELREEFDKYGLLLSSAIAASPFVMETAYDFPELGKHLDFFNLMAYDYHGAFNKVTGANSPLHAQSDRFSVADSLEYMKQAGAPLEKVMLGLPMYGQTFVLTDPEAEGSDKFGAPCNNTGFEGVYTAGAPGFLGYQEICATLKNTSWIQYWDENTGTPYMKCEELVVAYDDERSLTMKVDYALRFGIGGMMLWSVDTDDFRGACANNKKNPLAKRVNNAIVATLDDMASQSTTEDPGSSSSSSPGTTVGTTTTDPSEEWTQPPHRLNVICYVSTWANYRAEPGSFLIEHIDPTLCTHLIYAFAGLDNKTYTIKSLDPWTDLEDDGGKNFFKNMTRLRNDHPHLKVLLAIGGFNENSKTYSDLVSTEKRRKGFVDSVLIMLLKYEFDGLDLDWEYPAERGGVPADKENFVLLVKELREAFNKYEFLLSSAFHAAERVMATSYDLPELGKHLDFLNIMAYDYHGAFDRLTGANSPFYNQTDSYSIMDTLWYLKEAGAPMEKVMIGIPFYGQTFVMDNDDVHGFGNPSSDVGFASSYTVTPGFMGYHEICLELDEFGWERHWDDITGTPYMESERRLVSYDDEESMTLKIDYAVRFGVGGLMAWAIDTDDFQGHCGQVKYPILRHVSKTIVSTLAAMEAETTMSTSTSTSSSSETSVDSTTTSQPSTTTSTTTTTTTTTTTSTTTEATTTKDPNSSSLTSAASLFSLLLMTWIVLTAS